MNFALKIFKTGISAALCLANGGKNLIDLT